MSNEISYFEQFVLNECNQDYHLFDLLNHFTLTNNTCQDIMQKYLETMTFRFNLLNESHLVFEYNANFESFDKILVYVGEQKIATIGFSENKTIILEQDSNFILQDKLILNHPCYDIKAFMKFQRRVDNYEDEYWIDDPELKQYVNMDE